MKFSWFHSLTLSCICCLFIQLARTVRDVALRVLVTVLSVVGCGQMELKHIVNFTLKVYGIKPDCDPAVTTTTCFKNNHKEKPTGGFCIWDWVVLQKSNKLLLNNLIIMIFFNNTCTARQGWIEHFFLVTILNPFKEYFLNDGLWEESWIPS